MSKEPLLHGFRTRRSVLLGLASCATVGLSWKVMGQEVQDDGSRPSTDIAAGAGDGRRPYTWEDALARAEINAAQVSSRGDVALVTIRPLSAGGPHFGNARLEIAKRGELWLSDRNLSSFRKLDLDARWVWAPAFSPDGTQLAALTTGDDGRVVLAIWDVAGGEAALHEGVNVDIYGRLRTQDREQQTPLGAPQTPLQFVWAGNRRILFLAAGEQQTQFELAGLSWSETHGSLRGKAFRGEVSVRTWEPQSPTCFAGRQLIALETATGEMSQLYSGDLRGVSVSGDGRWAAILQADTRVSIGAEAAQNAPLRFTGIYDDPMVSCSLACVRLDDGTGFDVPGFAAVGNAAPSRLPLWSEDGRRVAVPSRLSYSPAAATGDDACWELDVETRETRSWLAASAADAEFIAALVVANDSRGVDQVIRQRRPIEAPLTGSVGQISARAWALGSGVVVKWNGNSLHLVLGEQERLLSDQCIAVASPTALSEGGHLIVALRKNNGLDAFQLAPGSQHRTQRSDMPERASLLCVAADGHVICKQDADDGSRVLVSVAGQPAMAAPFVLNRHLAAVRRPRAREIERTAADGTRLSGILLTPTNEPVGGRSPVIMWAYPNSTPRLDGWMTRINDGTAVVYPFQHLLAQGFAVFEAPLPMRQRPDNADPLEYVSASLVPWLDILDRQPEVMPGQYGFWGHSDAGYAALALEATTDRFKAIAAASTFPDLAGSSYSAHLAIQSLDCAGDLIQAKRFYYEAGDQHYRVGGSLWRNADGFVRNSAVFRMEHAVTPMLLLVGEYDAGPRSMEQVYSVLRGKDVPVELAYYWGEGHVINSPGNLRDLWARSERFFRRHLQPG